MSEIAGTMQSLELKVSSYMQTIGRLEMREADLMTENERLKTDFDNLVAMSADLQAQLAVNESQNTVEAEQLNALELQLDGLRESNEALKMAYEELEQKLAQREAVENGQEKEVYNYYLVFNIVSKVLVLLFIFTKGGAAFLAQNGE